VSDLGHAVVIGGGIAGVSAAYYLCLSNAFDRVTLLEAEKQLAFHTTGRSAALLTENYGTDAVRPLTTASLEFLHRPPSQLVDHPVLSPRGIMTIATSAADHETLDVQLAEGHTATHPIVEVSVDTAQELAPHVVFGPDHRIMWEEHAFDIDVATLHQAFVRGIRAHGGDVQTARRVDAARPNKGGWLIDTVAGPIDADVVVNAAGAWGDVVASAAGIAPVGLRPLKRTAFMVNSPIEGSADFAFAADAHHRWYVRPDGSQFLCSPADEAPSEPCDARADEIDIARTIDMINANTLLNIRSVNSQWAGLRTFSPDRSMVLGPDPANPTFIWCVGQGGTGIQTSPGAGQLVADLATIGEPGTTFAQSNLRLDSLLPGRFR